MTRVLLVVLVGVLPASPLKNALLRRLGWRVGADASIGPCLFVRIGSAEVGEGAAIGPFNVVRDLQSFELGDGAIMGQWNWLSAASPLVQGIGGSEVGAFRLGRHSAVTSRHYMDASGGIRIGEFTTVAGVRSTIITHGIDLQLSRQSVRGCSIGDYALVGSNVKLVPGAHVPDRSLVAMGSVVIPGLDATDSLYRGVPATPAAKRLVGKYFSRPRGPVDLPTSDVQEPPDGSVR